MKIKVKPVRWFNPFLPDVSSAETSRTELDVAPPSGRCSGAVVTTAAFQPGCDSRSWQTLGADISSRWFWVCVVVRVAGSNPVWLAAPTTVSSGLLPLWPPPTGQTDPVTCSTPYSSVTLKFFNIYLVLFCLYDVLIFSSLSLSLPSFLSPTPSLSPPPSPLSPPCLPPHTLFTSPSPLPASISPPLFELLFIIHSLHQLLQLLVQQFQVKEQQRGTRIRDGNKLRRRPIKTSHRHVFTDGQTRERRPDRKWLLTGSDSSYSERFIYYKCINLFILRHIQKDFKNCHQIKHFFSCDVIPADLFLDTDPSTGSDVNVILDQL